MSPSTNDNRKPWLPLQPNPFASTALQSAWGDVPVDVPAIHDTAFRAVLRALTQVRMTGQSTSIVVTGEPGSGKTHLLGRLRNRIEKDPETGAGETIYIYVRCNASAATLWRHLRLSLASDVMKTGVLDRMLRQRAESLENVDNLNLGRVLRCLHDGRNVLVASAWLRGESLTDDDLQTLNIKAEPDDEARNREWEAKLVTHALLHFFQTTPTVLCFDQVEGLETYANEQAGFHALGQVISELHARHNHLLLLSCVVSDYEERFQKSLIKADSDRVFKGKATLMPIEWGPALQIVKSRLDAAPMLAAERRAHPDDPWWPLDTDRLKPLFAATGLCLPRTLIQACSQQFDECMGDLPFARTGPPRSRADFLLEQYEANLAEARRTVIRQGADKTLGESLPWLLENSGVTVLAPDAERAQYAHVWYRGSDGDTALVFCYRRGNALYHALRRIENSWKAPVAVKILSDPSIQPKPGSVGAGILEKLKQRGARQIYPLPEALAALHAIRNLTTTALSGELSFEGGQITEREATQWALANLAPQVEQFKADLVGRSETYEDVMLPVLSELVARKKIVDVNAAARELSLQIEEVTACARRHPMHFGLLEGPPLVLFEAVEGSPPETPHA
jgi:hypothetical protein